MTERGREGWRKERRKEGEGWREGGEGEGDRNKQGKRVGISCP